MMTIKPEVHNVYHHCRQIQVYYTQVTVRTTTTNHK